MLFYLALSCTAKRSVKITEKAAAPTLPRGSESATGLGNPRKTNTNNKRRPGCDTQLVFNLSEKSLSNI